MDCRGRVSASADLRERLRRTVSDLRGDSVADSDRLGESSLDSVQSTIDIVGRERIVGAVALPS